MKTIQPSCLVRMSLFISVFFFLFFLPLLSAQACRRSCGKLPIKYPFGTGSGCGDPRFVRYVTCQSDETLTLTTHTGCYPITDIDYANQVFHVVDSTMSTCACTQPSRGFGLDWDAPFSFHDDTVFTLLDCSVDSSPVFTPLSNGTAGKVDLCDQRGTSICSFLYSNCRAISVMDVPMSTCCVYTPVDLGPSFEMDLQKLKCSGYSGFYSFAGRESDPESWKYGMALKYKFNVFDEFPGACADCERSNGACGYNTVTNSFVCNCPGGINTTSDCYFLSYNGGHNALLCGSWFPGTWLMGPIGLILVWMLTNL